MRIRKIAAFGAIAALALAGCASEDKKDEPSASPTAPAADRQIELWLAGEDTPAELISWLESEFKKKTEATLKVEQVGWGELIPRLQTALSNPKETPAVVEIGNTQTATFATVGAFTDLTDHLEELGGSKLGPQGFLDAAEVDGKTFAAPYYWGSRYVFYNTEMFKDAGVKEPTTLEEFNTVAEKLKDGDVSGFWLPGGDWRNSLSWIFANGGDIAVQEDGKWVGKMSSPESIKGLEQLQALQSKASNAPKDGDDADLWVPFNNGDSAMFMAPSWARWSLESEDNVGVFALPGADGGAAPVFAGGSNIAISKASPDQDLALELMKLIFSDDYQQMLAENGLGPANSTFNSLMGDDEYAAAALAAAENAKLTPAAAGWAAFEESKQFDEFFSKIAQGGDIAKEAAAIDAAIEKALN